MSRKSYVQINGVLYDKSLPLPEGVEAPQGKTATAILGDMPDFVSPIDGTVVRGRAGLRDHCARHNVVPTADLAGLPMKSANQPYQPDSAGIRDAIRRAVYN